MRTQTGPTATRIDGTTRSRQPTAFATRRGAVAARGAAALDAVLSELTQTAARPRGVQRLPHTRRRAPGRPASAGVLRRGVRLEPETARGTPAGAPRGRLACPPRAAAIDAST